MFRALLVALAVGLGTVAVAGEDENETDAIVEADAIIYVGADFSDARYFGKSWDKKRDKILPEYVPKANDKFARGFIEDMGKILGRKKIVTDMAGLEARHSGFEPVVSLEEQNPDASHMNPEVIRGLVASLEMREEEGVGLVFIAEQFIQRPGTSCYYATFFDVETREVIRANRECKGGGEGLGGMIVPLIEILEGMKRDYKRWNKNYELRHGGA